MTNHQRTILSMETRQLSETSYFNIHNTSILYTDIDAMINDCRIFSTMECAHAENDEMIYSQIVSIFDETVDIDYYCIWIYTVEDNPMVGFRIQEITNTAEIRECECADLLELTQ